MSDNIPFIRVPSSDFPSDILKWMKINAKPKMSLKLMKCCKYFQHFPEFPFFVVKKFEITPDETLLFITLDKKEHFYESLEEFENSNTKNLWITEHFYADEVSNLISRLIPKIAVCDFKRLSLFDQKITFDEFRFLTDSEKLKYLDLFDTIITFENGNPVFIDTLFKSLPNVKEINYHNHEVPIFSNDFVYTFKDINVPKLEYFNLNMISFSYFVLFTKFMDKNPNIKYIFEFLPNSLSTEETKTIEKYVQEVIDSGITEYPIPMIEFPGQTQEQYNALKFLSKNSKKI
uniref:DUF3822 family protein n=1 Tax=Panagrolaimus davidi TaxID=227884 RepID=A0A914QFM5_9BILA